MVSYKDLVGTDEYNYGEFRYTFKRNWFNIKDKNKNHEIHMEFGSKVSNTLLSCILSQLEQDGYDIVGLDRHLKSDKYREEIKHKALSKLTSEEIEILGL